MSPRRCAVVVFTLVIASWLVLAAVIIVVALAAVSA